MRSLSPLLVLVFYTAVLACGETVDSTGGPAAGGTSHGGGGATGGTTAAGGTGGGVHAGGTGGAGGVLSGEAIALLYSQFPPSSSGSSSSSSTSTSSGSSTSSSTSSTSSASSTSTSSTTTATSTSSTTTATSTSSTTTATSTTSTSTTSTSTTSTSTSTTSGGPDPNTLYILLSNQSLSCADPLAVDCGQWKVDIGIPPSLQHTGVIALSNPTLITFYSEMDGSCSGSSGGSFTDGTLEIVSIDTSEVSGVLANTWPQQLGVDGPFVAPRCP